MKKITRVLLGAVFLFGLGSLIAWGAGLIFIDDSGNFGIGNTTPLHKLDVSGSLYSRLVTLTDASSLTANWDSGNVQTVTLNVSNTTFTFSNAEAGGEYKLILKQDSTGGRTVTWPSGVKWQNATAPTLTSAANSIDVVNFVYDGTNHIGSYSLNHKSAPTVVFSDSFNRSDSSSVGNGWSEGVYNTWTDEGGYADRNAISGNAVKNTKYGSLAGGTISRTYTGATSDVKITGRFTWMNSGSDNAWVFLKSTADTWATGWGMVLSGNSVAIRDGSTNKASTSFTLSNSTSYDYEIQIDSNNHMFVYLWATSGSKPGTPTVSWENSGNPYTTTETGSLLSLTFAPDTTGAYGYWDFIEISTQ